MLKIQTAHPKRLVLSRETLRDLTAGQLKAVAGGGSWPIEDSGCASCATMSQTCDRGTLPM